MNKHKAAWTPEKRAAQSKQDETYMGSKTPSGEH
jgi:hypothetical protein